MFEARLVQGHILKNIVDSVKDLVNDANLECSEEEISIQCMDSSHVSLVAVSLQAAAFDHYRCDRPLALGVNSGNMAKIMKMMGRDDVVVLKAEDEPDNLTLMFESTKTDTIADFDLGSDRLMLTGGLSFSDLSFSNHDISLAATAETIAILSGVDTTALGSSDFV